MAAAEKPIVVKRISCLAIKETGRVQSGFGQERNGYDADTKGMREDKKPQLKYRRE